MPDLEVHRVACLADDGGFVGVGVMVEDGDGLTVGVVLSVGWSMYDTGADDVVEVDTKFTHGGLGGPVVGCAVGAKG